MTASSAGTRTSTRSCSAPRKVGSNYESASPDRQVHVDKRRLRGPAVKGQQPETGQAGT